MSTSAERANGADDFTLVDAGQTPETSGDVASRKEFLSLYDLSQPLTAVLKAGDNDEIVMRHVFRARRPQEIVDREAATIRKQHSLGKGRTRVEFDSDDANAELYDETIDYAVITEDEVEQRYDAERCKTLGRGVKIKAVDEVDNVFFRVLPNRQKGDFSFLFETEEKPPVLVEQLFGDKQKPTHRFVHVIKYIEPGTRKRYIRERQDVESETKKGKSTSEMERNPQPGIDLYLRTFDGIQKARYDDRPSEDIPAQELLKLNCIDPYWMSEAIEEAVEYLENRGVE